MVVLGGQREWEQKKSSLWVVSQVPLPEGYKGVPGNSASEMGWMNENVMGMILVWHQILDFTTSASQGTLRSRGALPEGYKGGPGNSASEMGWMNENVMGMISVWHQILDFTTSASQETLRSRGALPEWLTGAPAINAH